MMRARLHNIRRFARTALENTEMPYSFVAHHFPQRGRASSASVSSIGTTSTCSSTPSLAVATLMGHTEKTALKHYAESGLIKRMGESNILNCQMWNQRKTGHLMDTSGLKFFAGA